jgi:hypothetical protein
VFARAKTLEGPVDKMVLADEHLAITNRLLDQSDRALDAVLARLNVPARPARGGW